jgi:hypothetical protein
MNILTLIRKRGIICAYKKIKRCIFINNEDIIGLISLLGTYDYLQRYSYVLDRPIGDVSPEFVNPYPDKIWTCWLQGIENAPLIVQQCVNSIKAQHGSDVILLDNTNMAQYVEIPEYIDKKWRAGIMSNTHYSDIIRILLLSKYGGVWIDSTTFLLDKIPEYIRKAALFAFKGNPVAHVVASSWFIRAEQNNSTIRKVAELFCEYWKKENKLSSYSNIHLFFSMAINSSEATKAQWKAVPYFNDANCKMLQMELFDAFDAERLEQIKQMSPIQKLSYKFLPENFEQKGTFYDEVIRKF